MFEDYTVALAGILIILATLIVQALVASMTKAKQPGAVPGKMEASLGHESFVFRAQRTWMNSLENISAMLGTSFLAPLGQITTLIERARTGFYLGIRIIGAPSYLRNQAACIETSEQRTKQSRSAALEIEEMLHE